MHFSLFFSHQLEKILEVDQNPQMWSLEPQSKQISDFPEIRLYVFNRNVTSGCCDSFIFGFLRGFGMLSNFAETDFAFWSFFFSPDRESWRNLTKIRKSRPVSLGRSGFSDFGQILPTLMSCGEKKRPKCKICFRQVLKHPKPPRNPAHKAMTATGHHFPIENVKANFVKIHRDPEL